MEATFRVFNSDRKSSQRYLEEFREEFPETLTRDSVYEHGGFRYRVAGVVKVDGSVTVRLKIIKD